MEEEVTEEMLLAPPPLRANISYQPGSQRKQPAHPNRKLKRVLRRHSVEGRAGTCGAISLVNTAWEVQLLEASCP